MSRRPHTLEDAREFLWLLDQERAADPKAKQEALFTNIRDRDPSRWGQLRNMYRLLRMGKEDRKQNPDEASRWAWARHARDANREFLRRYEAEGAEAPETRKRRPDTGRQGID